MHFAGEILKIASTDLGNHFAAYDVKIGPGRLFFDLAQNLLQWFVDEQLEEVNSMETLLRTVQRVNQHLNPSLEMLGVVLTMYDKRTNLSAQVAEDVRAFLGDKVYETVIPRNIRVSEAPSHGRPVLLYDIECAGSQAYIHLAREVLRREGAAPATRRRLP